MISGMMYGALLVVMDVIVVVVDSPGALVDGFASVAASLVFY